MSRLSRITPLVIFLAFTIISGSQTDSNHGWSDDGSAYLLHARNLIEGRPYRDTGVISTPNYHGAPAAYPPGVPVLLLPLTLLWGLDFFTYKLLMIVILAASLAVLFVVLEERLGYWLSLATVVMFGANHHTRNMAQHINSDFLLLLLLLCVLLVVRTGMRREEEKRGFAVPLVAGAALFTVVLLTRSAALPILPGLLLYLTVTRRPRRFGLMLAGLMAVSALAGIAIADSYLDEVLFYLSYNSVRRNLIQYPLALADFFGAEPWATVPLVLLAAFGAILAWRRGPSLWDCVAVPYGLLLIAWPFSDPLRFGLPLLPLVLTYLVLGMEGIFALAGGSVSRVGWAATTTIVAAAVVLSAFGQGEHAGRTKGIFHPQANQLWSYVRRNTDENAVIVFMKARTLTLLTGRRGVRYSSLVPLDRFWDEICAVRPTHLISAPGLFPNDWRLLEPAVRARPRAHTVAFRNEDFALYALKDDACVGAGPPPVLRLPSRWDRNYPVP